MDIVNETSTVFACMSSMNKYFSKTVHTELIQAIT